MKPGVRWDLPVVEGKPISQKMDRPPKMLKRGAPDYPEEMARRNMRGTVDVILMIDERGRVTHVKAKGDPNLFFATMAERAVSYWRFEPAMKNGKPVSCQVDQRMEFGLH